MGKGDNRLTRKTRRRRNQRKKKARELAKRTPKAEVKRPRPAK